MCQFGRALLDFCRAMFGLRCHLKPDSLAWDSRVLVIGVGRGGRAMLQQVVKILPVSRGLHLSTCAIDWACVQEDEAEYIFRLHDSLTGSGGDPQANMILFRGCGFQRWLEHQYFEQVFVLGGLQGGTTGAVLPLLVGWLLDRHMETHVCGVLPLDFETPLSTFERSTYLTVLDNLRRFITDIDLHLVSGNAIAHRIGQAQSVLDIFEGIDRNVALIVSSCLGEKRPND